MSTACKRRFILQQPIGLSQGERGLTGPAGTSAFVYIRYASDTNGTDFSSIPNINRPYIGILQSTILLNPGVQDFTFFRYLGLPGTDGQDGSQNFIYIAYADAIDGTGFTNIFDSTKNFIAVLNSTVEIANPIASNFTGLWKRYAGIDGTDGSSFFGYIAYADDELGNGFTLTFDSTKTHIAILSSTVEIPSPSVTDFDGLWAKYLGTNGTDGREVELQATSTELQWRYVGDITWNTLVALSTITGPAGLDGTDGEDVFLYIAYADDLNGTNFTTTFDPGKDFIALLSSETEITTLTQASFSGLWTQYKGDGDRWATTSTTSAVIVATPMTLIVEPDLAYTTGQQVVAAQTGVPTNNVTGTVQSYNRATGLIVINPTATSGLGNTVNNWEVNISGTTAAIQERNNNIDGGGIDPTGQIAPKVDGGTL